MPKPALHGWWLCDQCNFSNNPALSNERCVSCYHAKCRNCRHGDGRVPAVGLNTKMSTTSKTVKTEGSTSPRPPLEVLVRPKTKTGQRSIADGHDLVRSTIGPAEQALTVEHGSVQGVSRSTSPDEGGPRKPTQYSKSNHNFSTDASQIDGRSEMSYSDSGNYGDVPHTLGQNRGLRCFSSKMNG